MSALPLMLPKVWAFSPGGCEAQAFSLNGREAQAFSPNGRRAQAFSPNGCEAQAFSKEAGTIEPGCAASLAEVFRAGVRKQPHGLRLVRAQAEETLERLHRPERSGRSAGTSTAASGPILLRKQAAAVEGIGYEFYRRYTEALLRRYVKLSMEAGRVPSMLGRELFRGHVSSYKVHSFEDSSNFVIDVERCLGLLDPGQRHLVRRIALEEYTQEEAAAMLGMTLRTVVRRYREAIDRVTRTLLDRGMMERLTAVPIEDEDGPVENSMGPILVKRGEPVEIS